MYDIVCYVSCSISNYNVLYHDRWVASEGPPRQQSGTGLGDRVQKQVWNIMFMYIISIIVITITIIIIIVIISSIMWLFYGVCPPPSKENPLIHVWHAVMLRYFSIVCDNSTRSRRQHHQEQAAAPPGAGGNTTRSRRQHHHEQEAAPPRTCCNTSGRYA